MYLRTPLSADCRAVVYARYSTDEQRKQSVEDQYDFCKDFAEEAGCQSQQVEILKDERLSGELRHRPGIDELRRGLEAGKWNVILVEDSSRLFRSVGPCMDFVGAAVDLGVRVICINDHVDTLDEDWQQRLEEAQRHHGQANYYTRFRIKRAFEGLWRMGAAVGGLRSGYRRSPRNDNEPKAPRFDEINPQWVPIIKQAFESVANGTSLDAVATYLTEQGLPKNSNGLSKTWKGNNVLRLIRSEVYRGVERYRVEVSKKKFLTGKSSPVRNPDPTRILKRNMPHFRMVADWVWHKANKAIDDRATPGVRPSGRNHPLHGVPRDSRHLLSNIFFCNVCKSKMYAEGRNEGGYRCSAARNGDCWNKATCLRELTHETICKAVSEAILQTSPDVIHVLVQHIQSLQSNRGRLEEERAKLTKRQDELARKQKRLLNAIMEQESTPAFVTAELTQLDAEQKQLGTEFEWLQGQMAERVELPSREKIKECLQQVASATAFDNDESRHLLRQLVDGPIYAVPYQPFGNTNVVLRAEFTLQMVRVLPDQISLMLADQQCVLDNQEAFRKCLSLNLFVSSKPHQYGGQAFELWSENREKPLTLEQLKKKLKISKRAAHLALQLGKQLNAAGISDPYIRLSDCPPNPSRWKFKTAD